MSGGRFVRRSSLAAVGTVAALVGLLLGPSAASAQETLAASCPGPGLGQQSGFPVDRGAQTFVPSLSGSLTRGEIDIFEGAADTGVYVIQTLAVDGTGTPTDTVLAETTVPEPPTGAATLNATFATPASVVAGQAYALALSRSDDWFWGYRNDACPGGFFRQPNSMGPWNADPETDDGLFNVFVTPPPGGPGGPGGPGVSATCKGKQATVIGTNGSDAFSGTPGRDVMAGLGGADRLSGLAGNDLICGGSGKDTLIGGKGKDKLYGQKGKDKLKGKAGKDLCVGGPGKDTAKKCEKTKTI